MAAKKETKNIEVKGVVEKMNDNQVKELIAKIGNKVIVNNKVINGKDLIINTPDKGAKRVMPIFANLELAEKVKWKVMEDEILAIVCEGRRRSCFWWKKDTILCANVSASSFNAIYSKIKGTNWEAGNRIYKAVVGRTDGLPKSAREIVSEKEIFGGN